MLNNCRLNCTVLIFSLHGSTSTNKFATRPMTDVFGSLLVLGHTKRSLVCSAKAAAITDNYQQISGQRLHAGSKIGHTLDKV